MYGKQHLPPSDMCTLLWDPCFPFVALLPANQQLCGMYIHLLGSQG